MSNTVSDQNEIMKAQIIINLRSLYSNEGKELPFNADLFKLHDFSEGIKKLYSFRRRCKKCKFTWPWSQTDSRTQVWLGNKFEIKDTIPEEFFNEVHACKNEVPEENVEAQKCGAQESNLPFLEKAPNKNDPRFAEFFRFVGESVEKHKNTHVRSLK